MSGSGKTRLQPTPPIRKDTGTTIPKGKNNKPETRRSQTGSQSIGETIALEQSPKHTLRPGKTEALGQRNPEKRAFVAPRIGDSSSSRTRTAAIVTPNNGPKPEVAAAVAPSKPPKLPEHVAGYLKDIEERKKIVKGYIENPKLVYQLRTKYFQKNAADERKDPDSAQRYGEILDSYKKKMVILLRCRDILNNAESTIKKLAAKSETLPACTNTAENAWKDYEAVMKCYTDDGVKLDRASEPYMSKYSYQLNLIMTS